MPGGNGCRAKGQGRRRAGGGRVQGRVCDNVIMSGSLSERGMQPALLAWCAGALANSGRGGRALCQPWAGLEGLGAVSGQRAGLHRGCTGLALGWHCATQPSIKYHSLASGVWDWHTAHTEQATTAQAILQGRRQVRRMDANCRRQAAGSKAGRSKADAPDLLSVQTPPGGDGQKESSSAVETLETVEKSKQACRTVCLLSRRSQASAVLSVPLRFPLVPAGEGRLCSDDERKRVQAHRIGHCLLHTRFGGTKPGKLGSWAGCAVEAPVLRSQTAGARGAEGGRRGARRRGSRRLLNPTCVRASFASWPAWIGFLCCSLQTTLTVCAR